MGINNVNAATHFETRLQVSVFQYNGRPTHQSTLLFQPLGLKQPPTTSIKPQYLQLVRHPSLVQHMRVEDIAEGFDLTSSFGQLAPDQKVTVTTDGQYHHVRCAGALLHHAKSQCDYN